MRVRQVRGCRRPAPVSGPWCRAAAMAGQPRRGPGALSSLGGPRRLLAWAWEAVVPALVASQGHGKRTVPPGGRSRIG